MSSIRFTDNSRVTTDWTCPMARYWAYEHCGRGVAPIEPAIELSFGDAIARAAESIRGEGQHTCRYTGPLPWAALYAGLTQAFLTRVWPLWVQQFRLVATEVECLLDLGDGILYQARPDAIVERLSDHTYWYIQDKTTSLSPENFTKGWDKHAELHATCLAVEQQLGLTMSGAYVQGWCKGYLKNETLYSPLAYCWLKPAQPGAGKPQPSFEYRPGWPRTPITNLPSVAAWVASLPEPLIQQQFPVTQPITLRRDLAETYLAQVKARERQIANGLTVWPQHFNQCDDYSKYRRPCAWRDCCWAPTVKRDPVASGMYVWRQAHHEAEREALEGK